ncbi:transcriptional regulator, MarR family [Cryobacterium psychrotolerans]|uniref:Transcriptional regulator, MarR family n=1 Tax=Cryobacterium psychrotolerans TaxID=386301 RepID=A0A1G9G6L2_9MICO|nr:MULTISPECIES: MarR family transcriptional regulator [Cryobacterium]TFD42331.1 MarR family transcriptional regulator [Cryobacterium sp. TMT1-2-1]TFD83855.1 MarR family transcriptional regulator [Cryobacterium psychrotolerans]SDK96242.1 transcriptional regulator, MarR family [Cryobacterium psychrotolerans]
MTTAEALAEVEEQMNILAGLIRRSIRDAALSIDPALQPFGLKLLRLLSRSGPTHASAVAEALTVDRSVVSRQAAQLQELGLLEIQADPSDGRARFLALTPAAEQKLAELRAGKIAVVNRRLGTWPEADLRQFAALIARLNAPDAQ